LRVSKAVDTLRAAVADLPMLDKHQVTMSIGVTEIQATYNGKKWMKLTDGKLYEAKRSGRNQIVH
jgi:PleD family two-component response regulator